MLFFFSFFLNIFIYFFLTIEFFSRYSVSRCSVTLFSNTPLDEIGNGNRTEWSPILSEIIRVINKIGRPRSGSPICLIMSMITDRIGRHKVLLPINHKYNKIREKIKIKRSLLRTYHQ